jgi:hypothetical protein
MEECGLPLRMMFTVDFIHENYEPETERIPFLDNLLAARNCYDGGERITLTSISHWTNDESQNIPLSVFDYYADQGVQCSINDFMVWGRGAELTDLACYIEVGSTEKDGLGPYRSILLRDMIYSGKIGDEDEFEKAPNRELLKQMSVCGRAPNFFISWGNKYFYCIPHMGHDWFSISDVGQLSTEAMASFFADRPIIREIQTRSIFGALDEHTDLVDGDTLEEIGSMRESIRFAGCSVCLKMYRKGILQEINRKILGMITP